jgi:L-asparagine transporter-like permease
MRDQFPPVSINFSSLKVTGWPGLALVLVVVAVAMEFPQTRWLLLSGIVAGALLAAVWIVLRDRRA